MALEKTTKDLLNKFADSQPALNDDFSPRDSSGVKLGDILDEAHGAVRSKSVTYTASSDGGTAGSTYTLKGASVPAGAIITRAWVAENVALVGTPLTSTLDVTIGATSLTGGAKLITALTGIQEAKADLTATLPEATSGGAPKVTVAGADVTAGQLLITFEYIYPVS